MMFFNALAMGLLVASTAETSELALEAPDSVESKVERVSIVGSSVSSLELLGSTSILSNEDIEKFKFDDIGQVLTRIPGVNIRQEDGYGLRPNIGFRGVTPNRSKKINILEDGILIGPAPYSAPAAYYFPLMSKIQSVEVTKGAEMIKYGPNTVAGVLNLVTRSIPEALETGVDAMMGANGYQKLTLHHGNRKSGFGYLVEGSVISADGFKQLDNGGDTGFDKSDVMVKLDYQWNTVAIDHVVALKMSYADEFSNETYLGLSDEDFATTPYRRYSATQRDRMDWEHNQVQLTHQMQASEWNITTRIYNHDFTRSWSKLNGVRSGQGEAPPSLQSILQSPDNYRNYYQVLTGDSDSTIREILTIGDNARRYYSRGIQLDGSIDFPLFRQEHEFVAGVRYHQDQIQRDHVEDDFFMRQGLLERTSEPQRLGATNEESTDAISSYLQSIWTFDKLKLSFSARNEFIDGHYLNRISGDWLKKTTQVTLPAFSSVYSLPNQQSVIFGIHKGFVPTSPQQSPEKAPEQSTNVEFGWRVSTANIDAEIVGFYNQYDNLAETCSQSAGENCTTNIDIQYDAGEVDVYGFESSASGVINVPDTSLSLPWFFTYTNTQSEFQTSFASSFQQWGTVTKGESLPYLAEHVVTLGSTIESDSWQASLRLNHQSGMKEAAGEDVNLSGVETAPITLVDLSGRYELSNDSIIYVKIDNLFDTVKVISRRPYGARPNRLRQWFVGYKHAF